MTKQLSADTIENIYKLYGEKVPQRAIAKQLGVAYSSVRKYIAAGPSAGQPPPGKSTPTPMRQAAPAAALGEAVTVAIAPRRFEVNSTLLWQAMEVTRREWHWPEYSPGDWLDTFLYYAFKQRGIVLGGYQVLERRSGDG